jgi:hypothetical protein
VDLHIHVGNGLVDLENIGSGYYQLMAIVFNLVHEKPTLLLFDEPEISLHPSAQRKFFSLLKKLSDSIQTLIATHSTIFLDVNDLDHVYKFSKYERTQVFRLQNIELNRTNNERFFNLQLKELFFVDEAVFVEGPDDFEFLYQRLNEKFPGSDFWEGKIFQMNGCSTEKLQKYQAIVEALGIKAVFLVDFDKNIYFNNTISFLERLMEARAHSRLIQAEPLRRVIRVNRTESVENARGIFRSYWAENAGKFFENENFQRIFIKPMLAKGIYLAPWIDVAMFDATTGSSAFLRDFILAIERHLRV